ncbi:MAG: SurA N-terminal domain-containing protein [Deltaproteobacteria bacterium]|nr:SurA N-terminal domain-containing protein [Deltaproteobacteria bacterium]
MLEVFRKQSRSILIYVFFGIIIAVFVINFGPQSQGCGGAATHQGVAAKVGSQEMSDGAFYFGWFVYNGPNMRPERARALRLKERIMSKLIERELFAQEAEKLGLTVSERDVEEMLEDGRMVVLGVRQNVRGWIFKKDVFDKALLERFVQFQLNMSLKRFVEEERREMLAERMRELVRGSIKVSPDEVRRAYDQEHLKVNLEFVRFDPLKIDVGDPTAAELDAFVKDKKKEIEAYYKSHSYEYTKLRPQVRTRQIVFQAEKDAKPEVAKVKEAAAKAALQKALKGDDFAALAAKLSEDEATRGKGGEIGWKEIARLGLGPDDQKRVGAAKAGVLGEVLRTDQGFVLMKLEEKREGDIRLEAVEREIAAKLIMTDRRKARAKEMAEETLKKVKDGTKLDAMFPKKKEEPDEASSQPRLARPKLVGVPELEETGAFERRGNVVSQIGVSADLAKAAFDAKSDKPVLDKVWEVGGTFIVARLKERQEPVPAEFEKQKDEFTRRQQLQKWGEVLSDWAQRQCVAIRDAGRINVNHDLLVYEGKGGAADSASFQPCQNVY